MKIDDPKRDDEDLRDMIDIYRTLKNLSKFLPWFVGFVLVVLSAILETKRIFNK